MQQGLAREARRRPDLDLLVGPLEEAAASSEPAEPGDPEPFEVDEAEDRPTWREDG